MKFNYFAQMSEQIGQIEMTLVLLKGINIFFTTQRYLSVHFLPMVVIRTSLLRAFIVKTHQQYQWFSVLIRFHRSEFHPDKLHLKCGWSSIPILCGLPV